MFPTLGDLSVIQVLVLLLPTGIPFLVDLVTKSSAPVALKRWLALALSAILGAVQAAVVGTGERWQDYVSGILYAAVIAFLTHSTGVTDGVQRATADFGIGGESPSPSPAPAQSPPTVIVDAPAPQRWIGDTGD